MAASYHSALGIPCPSSRTQSVPTAVPTVVCTVVSETDGESVFRNYFRAETGEKQKLRPRKLCPAYLVITWLWLYDSVEASSPGLS